MRHRVAAGDAMWLQDSATNLMVINAVFTTDRLDVQTVRHTFATRLLGGTGHRTGATVRRWDGATHGVRHPRFMRRVVWKRGTPWWEDDPAFDIARHIIPASEEGLDTTTGLQEYIGRSASQPLPDDRPLWQIQVVEQFEDDASAFVVRIHHAMGDGISLVSVIMELMEEVADEGGAPPPGRARTAGSPGATLRRALTIPFAAPGILLKRLLWRPDRHALHGAPVSGTKQVGWTASLDLAVVKRAKNLLDATVNDVLMATVSGAISRYLARHADQIVAQIRVSMPVNVRPADEAPSMGNRFAAVPLELLAGIPHLPDRVRAIKRQMDDLKQSVVPVVVYGLQQAMLTVLPQAMSRGLIDFLANKCTAVVTNVPGPAGVLQLAGRRVRSMMFWVPQRADIGIGISILSFAGRVQVGVMADASLVADAGDLVFAFEEEFEALREL